MGRVILLALWAVVSRLLGLVRDLFMAWLVGSGWLADALVAATVIPHALRKLLADGVLSMPFTAAAARGGPRPADRDLFPLLQRILALSGALLLVLFACAPVVVKCLAPGGQDPVWIGKAASLLRLAAPFAFFVFFSAPAMGLLHARGAFASASSAPVCFNFVILCFIFAAWAGAGQADVMIAAGFAAGGAVQALLLWFFVLRGRDMAGTEEMGEQPVPSKGEEHAVAFCTALKRLPGVVFSCSSLQLCFLAALGAASLTGEGAITSLYFADRLLELPVGIVGACMGIAALPDLTREAAAEDRKGFMESLGLALHTGLLFAIPAASGLFAISAPLVGLLLGHGEYSDAGLSGTVLCLRALIPALPACIMLRTLVAACHAWGMDRLAILSTAAAAAGAGVTGVSLTFVWTGSSFLPASAIGPLCASAALWVQTGILIWGLLVRARSGKHPFTGTFFSLKALAGLIFCGLTAGAAAMGVQMFGVENRLLTLGLAVCGGGGCWLVSVRILLPEDFRLLFGKAGKKPGLSVPGGPDKDRNSPGIKMEKIPQSEEHASTGFEK